MNSLGEVTWSDMETISRSLYLRRQVNSTFCVSMFGKRASIQVPLGSTHVQVEGPALDGSPGETLFWRAVSEDLSWKVLSRSQAFAVKPGAMIEIAFQSTLSSPSKTYRLQTTIGTAPVRAKIIDRGTRPSAAANSSPYAPGGGEPVDVEHPITQIPQWCPRAERAHIHRGCQGMQETKSNSASTSTSTQA